jgi:enamine deaminase RidA (YjgF/YER057c/UK114 family)
MKRLPVNPWQWSVGFGYNQGELVSGTTRTLYLAGQAACDENGEPQHAGDMRAQVELSIANIESVLRDAGMTLANVVRLNIYVTDIDAYWGCMDVLAGRLAAAGIAPPGSLLQVAGLAMPGLMVELEATAVD